MNKVLICNPPSKGADKIIREGRCTQRSSFWSLNYPPLTLAQLTSLLKRDSDVIVETHDFGVGVGFKQAFDKINITPNYAVVNIGSTQFDTDIEFCRLLNKKYQCEIIVIGTHVSSFAQEVLNEFPFIKYVCINEPEFTILKFFKKPMDDSVFVSKENTNVVNNFDNSIEELPAPDWSSFELANYKLPSTGEKFLMVNPTRGCPWKCSFCTAPLFYGNRLRTRSVDKVVKEIKDLKDKYGIDNFLLWSDTFTANKKYVKDLCYELKKLSIRWVSNSRVDTLDYETAKVMKESGCWLLTFGIETHNDKTLSRIRKGYKEVDITRGVNAAKDAGILTVGHYILGLPGESCEDMRRTYQKSKELGLDYSQFYYATPFPGTKLYKELSQFNNLTPFDNYSQDHCYYNGIVTVRDLKKLKDEFSIKSLFRVETVNFVGRSFTIRQILKTLLQLRTHLRI